MKNLKLEVGKTYLNRKGERVKIVDNNGHVLFPFDGDDCLSYTLDGRYWYDWRDSALDLIAEAEAADTEKRTFKIPENTREISVSETDGRIVIEFVPEVKGPKPGDVMINIHDSVYIFKDVFGSGDHKHYAWLGKDGRLTYNSVAIPGRPATPEEAQQLFDALAKDGKRWNPDTLKIEKLTERERMRAFLHQRGWVGVSEDSISDIEAYIKHREAQQCK